MLPLMVVLSAAAADRTVAPGESIQAALNEASPGDIITIEPGTYEEDLSTEVDGEEDRPIVVRAAEPGSVVITSAGEVLQVDHRYWRFTGLVFDGQFGSADTLDINDHADHLVLSEVEVRRSGRDCIDMGSPSGVEIRDSHIHHCLHYNRDDEVRVDAHGITGGAVQDLKIIDTDIHTFSGDAIQFDPGREAPGWNNITVQGCRLWLEPLEEDTNGFLAGQVPGENAIDTKTVPEGERATLIVADTEAWGFRDGVDFSNQAAFLLKENVDVTVRRVHVYDSEMAFRVRGATDSSPEGAVVRVESSLIHHVEVGVRYEDDLSELKLWHITFGAGVTAPFSNGDSDTASVAVINSLFLTDELPVEATQDESNSIATSDDFVDAADHDYHLVEDSLAIDAGVPITGVTQDLDGNRRVSGLGPDLGAYEWDEETDSGLFDDDTGRLGEDSDPTDSDEGADDGATDDTAEPDSPRSEPGGGVGAADRVGERGGCGCTTPISTASRMWPWLVMPLLVRRRRVYTA